MVAIPIVIPDSNIDISNCPPNWRSIFDVKNWFRDRGGWLEGDFTNLDEIARLYPRFGICRRKYAYLMIDLFPEVQIEFPDIDSETLRVLLFDEDNAKWVTISSMVDNDKMIPLYCLDESIHSVRRWRDQNPWCERCKKRHSLPREISSRDTLLTINQVLNNFQRKTGPDFSLKEFSKFRKRRKSRCRKPFPKSIRLGFNCYVWSENEIQTWINSGEVVYLYNFKDVLIQRQRKEAEKMMKGVIASLTAAVVK